MPCKRIENDTYSVLLIKLAFASLSDVYHFKHVSVIALFNGHNIFNTEHSIVNIFKHTKFHGKPSIYKKVCTGTSDRQTNCIHKNFQV